MATYKRTLLDKNGDQIAPRTTSDAITVVSNPLTTVATNYFVDNGDGVLKQKPLANVKAEILATPTVTGILTVAGRIKFPATQNPSTDVNTLDDYEEGTFEPTIFGTNSAGVATYVTRVGVYTKIGNVVNFAINLEWSAHSGTGGFRISGLPFALKTLTGYWETYAIFPYNINLASGYDTSVAWNATGETTIYLHQYNNLGVITNMVVDTVGNMVISGKYLV